MLATTPDVTRTRSVFIHSYTITLDSRYWMVQYTEGSRIGSWLGFGRTCIRALGHVVLYSKQKSLPHWLVLGGVLRRAIKKIMILSDSQGALLAVKA